jgi:putative ABC transport system permease protein
MKRFAPTGLLQDIRFALRGMRRSPGFFAGAALVLALGIGLSTATFDVFYTVLVRPLPVVDQERIGIFLGQLADARTQLIPPSRRQLADFRRETRTLSAVAGVGWDGPWSWYVRDPSDSRHAIIVPSSVVTANFFDVLGVKPLIGRTLRPQDDELGAPKVLVINRELWRREYGDDPGVLGRQLVDQSAGTAYTIVGVMPEGLSFERGAELWRPLNAQFPVRADSDLDSPFGAVRVVGRLAPGATLGAARDEFARFFSRAMTTRNPALAGRISAVAHSLGDEVMGDVRPALRIIAAAVALLLLITCVNVASLMLIRASGRISELAVRASLGATRGRIVRQLVIEGIVLALAGGVFGVLIAAGALRGLVALAPTQLPRITSVRLDATTLGVAVALSLATVVLFAVGPALSISSGDLFAFVRSGARSLTGSRQSRRGRNALVVVQFALTLVVLTGAGLLARSLERLQRLDLGFDEERLAVVELRFHDDNRTTVATINDLIDRLRARLGAVSGVSSVAAAIQTPFQGSGIDGWVSAEGESNAQHAGDPFVDLEFVTPNYFRTLNTRVLAGRSFSDADAATTTPVVVISKSVADHFWPGETAVGKRLHCFGGNELCPVVGVVDNTHYRDLVKPHRAVYRVSRQAPEGVFAPRVLLVATRGDPSKLLPTIRSLVMNTEPEVTLGRVQAVHDLLRAPLAQPRFNLALVAVFATVALVLAGMGIFGVLAFHVAQRTRELGIRHALGATPRELRGMLLREGLILAGTGIVAGLFVSILATRSLNSLLFDTTPFDPLAFLGATTLLVCCGLAGVAIPARHAARVDPIAALRAE